MTKKLYSREFKEAAVKLVVNEGVGIGQAAQEVGVSQSALRKWVTACRESGAEAFPGSGKLRPEEQRIRELEKRLRVAEMERDILKKATAFFAKESL